MNASENKPPTRLIRASALRLWSSDSAAIRRGIHVRPRTPAITASATPIA